MALLFGDEAVPYAAVGLQPFVWSGIKDIVGEKIVIAKGWDNRNRQRAMIRESVDNFLGDLGVHIQHLTGVSWSLLIAIVACGVTSPYNKVNIVLYMSPNPVQCRVDELHGGVAIGGFGAI